MRLPGGSLESQRFAVVYLRLVLGLESNVEPSFETGQNLLNNGVVLTARKLLEVPIVFVDDEAMSQSEAKSKVRQILLTGYPADLDKSSAAAPEEVASIDLIASDIEGGAY